MLHQLQSILPQIESLTHKDFFIVTSIGKSGSTWVQKILDAHPQIYCAGEGKFQPLLSHLLEAFKKHNQELNKSNHLIYSDSPYYQTWQDPQALTTIQFFVTLALLNSPKPIPASTRLIGDKDTAYLKNLKNWHHSILPQSKIIHVIRDVRDATVSNYHHLKRQGNPMQPGDQDFYRFVQLFTSSWKHAITQARHVTRSSPNRYHEIRYEDLHLDPHTHAQILFHFLNISASSKQLTQCLHQASFQHQSGGRPPGKENKDSFYRKGIVGDWKNFLDDKALDIIYQETQELLLKLGYNTPT